MIELNDLERLKQLNKVTRVCAKKNNECTEKVIQGLITQVDMLQKQKKFLQKKLREACNDAKTKKTTKIQ